MTVIWEIFTEALQLRTGASVGLFVPKHHVTLEAEETRTEPGPKASSGPIVCRPAWYDHSARDWYQAKTTDFIQSVFLSAAAGWWGGRKIIEALFQLAHPTPATLFP